MTTPKITKEQAEEILADLIQAGGDKYGIIPEGWTGSGALPVWPAFFRAVADALESPGEDPELQKLVESGQKIRDQVREDFQTQTTITEETMRFRVNADALEEK